MKDELKDELNLRAVEIIKELMRNGVRHIRPREAAGLSHDEFYWFQEYTGMNADEVLRKTGITATMLSKVRLEGETMRNLSEAAAQAAIIQYIYSKIKDKRKTEDEEVEITVEDDGDREERYEDEELPRWV